MGLLYGDANDYVSALKYLNQASDVYQDDPALLLSIYNNRAVAWQELGRYSEAEVEFRRALALGYTIGNQLLVARIVGNVARVRLKAGDVRGASMLVEKALTLAGRGDALASRPQVIGIAAQVALQRHDLFRARSLITERFAGVDPGTTTLQFREAHQTAYEVYRALGDDHMAMVHLAALKRLDDQATKLATSANTALAAARFDFANQELRIQTMRNGELRRNVAFEQARTRTQRYIFLGIALGTAVIMTMLAAALITIRRSRNRERVANADLAVTNMALGKALTAKTEFLATTSHEIRTPLNGILGMTQVMLADQKVAGDLRDRIGVVHGAGVTMKALVDDILDVAKMEAGNLTIEHAPFDLKEALIDASRLWAHQAEMKGVGFDLELGHCPRLIEGDVARVRQIVFNLLSNALKFTGAGRMSLAVSCEGGSYRISVEDSGIGIAADKLEQIFESFRQADAGTTRRFGGTGLGLAICRNLSRAMGGEVSVVSTPGAGSTFTVTLPLVDATPLTVAAPVPASGDTVLIVDANPITRVMLRTLVAPHAGSVLCVASIAEGLETLAAGGIKRVLIDCGALADRDRAAPSLRALVDAAGPSTRTTLLWSGPVPDLVAEAGVDAILAKPITGSVLVSRLFAHNSGADTDAALVPRAA